MRFSPVMGDSSRRRDGPSSVLTGVVVEDALEVTDELTSVHYVCRSSFVVDSFIHHADQAQAGRLV